MLYSHESDPAFVSLKSLQDELAKQRDDLVERAEQLVRFAEGGVLSTTDAGRARIVAELLTRAEGLNLALREVGIHLSTAKHDHYARLAQRDAALDHKRRQP